MAACWNLNYYVNVRLKLRALLLGEKRPSPGFFPRPVLAIARIEMAEAFAGGSPLSAGMRPLL